MRHLIFSVANKRRACPKRWWLRLQGPKPSVDFKCDGCSNSPDYWRRIQLWPACVIHDYHYREAVFGEDARARKLADKKFRHNMVTLIRLQGGSEARAYALAWFYWGRVRVWGRKAYRRGLGTVKPLPWYRRLAEAWGLGNGHDQR